jgi:cytidylate kinase
MSIIILSSDSVQAADQIGRATADAIGYKCLGPDMLPDIAARYDTPVDKLAEALGKCNSAWRRIRAKRMTQLLAYIEAEVLDRLKADHIVCWGLAAHLYVQGVSHALKVRLLADNEQQTERIAAERGISILKAAKQLQNETRKLEQWSLSTFGQNEADPAMYDLVINLGQIDPDEAVRALSAAVGYRKFQPMTYSMKSLAESALAAKVKTKLLESMSDIRVQARDGRVVVTSKALKRERLKKAAAIKELAGQVEGVEFVEVHLINYVIREAAESFR